MEAKDLKDAIGGAGSVAGKSFVEEIDEFLKDLMKTLGEKEGDIDLTEYNKDMPKVGDRFDLTGAEWGNKGICMLAVVGVPTGKHARRAVKELKGIEVNENTAFISAIDVDGTKSITETPVIVEDIRRISFEDFKAILSCNTFPNLAMRVYKTKIKAEPTAKTTDRPIEAGDRVKIIRVAAPAIRTDAQEEDGWGPVHGAVGTVKSVDKLGNMTFLVELDKPTETKSGIATLVWCYKVERI